MAEIIDLTVSPRPETIEISSEQENTATAGHNRTRDKKWKKTANGLSKSAQPLRIHSPETEHKSSEPTSPPTTDEPGLFRFDGAAAPIHADDTPPPEPIESNEDEENKLLLPSHVVVFCDNGPSPTPAQVIPPPQPGSDEEECIQYLDYEDRKAPGFVRYFEVEGDESNHSKSLIFKCKNCGAEGDHKTYECPVQICLTCGARDEHSTRSCPISKTCYTCGMKGHINKTCPNRFSTYTASSDLHGNCDRCGSAEHNMNECPTLWRIYQYVNDEERILILQSREQKKQPAIGDGGEGYIGGALWCYNCAKTGHLGDDCNELPHPVSFPMEYSAFSFHNIMSGPFYDPATEPISIERWRRERESSVDRHRLPDDWDAGALVNVGKRGKNKDKERLEKRFREQEDDGEDWFNNIRNVKKRGTDQRASSPAPRGGRKFKFGLFKDGGHGPSSPPPSLPSSGSGLSLLARLSDTPERRQQGKADRGRERPEPRRQSDSTIRIRGAATNQRSQERWDRGSKRGHGPRYRGGYER